MKRSGFILALVSLLWHSSPVRGDWPTLRGNSQRTGFVPTALKAPFRLAWVRSFQNERLGTAMEPIVADTRVFVATHNGNLYALDAQEGRPLWRFQAHGAFLHSPAYSDGVVVAGNADGHLYAMDAKTGQLRWSFDGGEGGFSAAPTISDGTVFLGARNGEFFAVGLSTGRSVWRQALSAPIRQSAAFGHGSVLVTSEDLRVHCFDAGTGQEVWRSEPLVGQTARDYYPIVVESGGRTYVIVRTNPILSMGNHIGRDRHFLCQNASVDDNGWQKVDAWIKSESAKGSPELWAKEQVAVKNYLQTNKTARTFFVLDGNTGQEAATAPVLWVAGCQGVGAEPVLAADGRMLVFYRSAYGNWNHGVAPLVTLGLLNLTENRITPLEHQSGRQPPWNTFWGTADESQNFTVAGDTVLIVHQGTLSGFDLKSSRLFKIWGERDTYGGLRSPPWARNEWHGPGRGSVAVDGPRIYWLTGSRVFCLVAGESGQAAPDMAVDGATVSAQVAPKPAALNKTRIENSLNKAIDEILAKRWAPWYVEPGLAGRDFSFDHSGELFETLAWSYPHLDNARQSRVKTRLAEEWATHPPFAKEAWLSLKEGEPREYSWIPDEVRARLSQDKPPHPFGNIHAVWLFAERCGEWTRVTEAWPKLKGSFDDFRKSGWRLDGAKGDLYANRYLASLLAITRIAEKAGDADAATQAKAMVVENSEALVAWWKRAAAQGTLTAFKGSGELDPFIGRGDGLSFRVAPHRHKVALFSDLTPEVAELVRRGAAEAVEKVWQTFAMLYRTWPLTGEERQVHFGENFVDPPDLALGGFRALAWLRKASPDVLARHVDLPVCHADLYFATKLSLVLEQRN